jgi:hypothetical protein
LSITEGFHVPLMPFVEVEGKTGAEDPAHIAIVVPKLKSGVIIGFTVTDKLVVVAHCPASGVNV